MKSINEMHNAAGLLLMNEGDDGFNGEIRMPRWKGSIVASWGGGWEHVSVSPYKRSITPSWDDMCRIKNLFWNDDECVVQYHPPKSEYINNMPNCLHLWKPVGREIEMPPSIMVGVKNGETLDDVKRKIKELL